MSVRLDQVKKGDTVYCRLARWAPRGLSEKRESRVQAFEVRAVSRTHIHIGCGSRPRDWEKFKKRPKHRHDPILFTSPEDCADYAERILRWDTARAVIRETRWIPDEDAVQAAEELARRIARGEK